MDFDTKNFNDIEWQLIVKGSEKLQKLLNDAKFEPFGLLYDRLVSCDELIIFDIAVLKELVIEKIYKIFKQNSFEFFEMNRRIINYYLELDKLNRKLESMYGMASADFKVIRIDYEETEFSSGNKYLRFKYFISINDVFEYFTFEIHELLTDLRFTIDSNGICSPWDIERYKLEDRPDPNSHFVNEIKKQNITIKTLELLSIN